MRWAPRMGIQGLNRSVESAELVPLKRTYRLVSFWALREGEMPKQMAPSISNATRGRSHFFIPNLLVGLLVDHFLNRLRYLTAEFQPSGLGGPHRILGDLGFGLG